MAKKKAAAAPETEDRERKPMAIQVRATQEWKAWAEELAEFDSRALASLVDRALQRYADEIGFKKKAPKR